MHMIFAVDFDFYYVNLYYIFSMCICKLHNYNV